MITKSIKKIKELETIILAQFNRKMIIRIKYSHINLKLTGLGTTLKQYLLTQGFHTNRNLESKFNSS